MDANFHYSIKSVSIGRAGCSTPYTPCYMKFSLKPDTSTAEMECGGKKYKATSILGAEGEIETGWVGINLFAMLWGSPVTTNSTTVSGVTTTISGTAIVGGTTLPTGLTIEAVAQEVNTGKWVIILVTGASITSPPAIDWEMNKAASYTLEFYASEFEVIESDALTAPTFMYDWLASLIPAAVYHAGHDVTNYTFGSFPAVAAVCNEVSKVSDLVQASATRQPSLIGNKLIFDGVDDNLTNSVISPAVTATATIAFVARITETNATTTHQTVLQSNIAGVSLAFTDTTVRISGVATNIPFTHNKTWHRYIYVMNGTSHQLWVDGAKVGNPITGVAPNIIALQVGQIAAAATLGMEVTEVSLSRVAITDPAWIAVLDSKLASTIP